MERVIEAGVRGVGHIGNRTALWLVLLERPMLGIAEMDSWDCHCALKGEHHDSTV